jgi:hypothetical protein
MLKDTGCWMLDAGEERKILIIYPVSRDQYQVSAGFMRLCLLYKLDTNFKILAY